MFTSQQNNTVYFSDRISTEPYFAPAYQRIRDLLIKYQISFHLLKDTKDVWCRDYMPIQIGKDEFVQFRYEPSYLVGYDHYQSDPSVVLPSNNIKADFSTINLDGGNVVNWTDKAILTTRVFKENPAWEPAALIDKLEETLKVKIFLVPDITNDLTGHSDGHLRFVDSKTVLVNSLQNEYEYWKKGFYKMIEKAEMSFVEMPWFIDCDKTHKHSAIGCYVNYLEIGELIIFPIFEVAGNKDQEALDMISSVFPDRKIEPININEIGKYGGLMNCSTWTVHR